MQINPLNPFQRLALSQQLLKIEEKCSNGEEEGTFKEATTRVSSPWRSCDAGRIRKAKIQKENDKIEIIFSFRPSVQVQ